MIVIMNWGIEIMGMVITLKRKERRGKRKREQLQHCL